MNLVKSYAEEMQAILVQSSAKRVRGRLGAVRGKEARRRPPGRTGTGPGRSLLQGGGLLGESEKPSEQRRPCRRCRAADARRRSDVAAPFGSRGKRAWRRALAPCADGGGRREDCPGEGTGGGAHLGRLVRHARVCTEEYQHARDGETALEGRVVEGDVTLRSRRRWAR